MHNVFAVAQVKTDVVNDEIEALRVVLAALAKLGVDSRRRVLALVDQYYKAGVPPGGSADVGGNGPPKNALQPALADVRSLKENKRPGNAVEMAALVAYYLAELAPEGERSKILTRNLLTKYFKQAGYPLPKHPNMTLVDTKNAGYLDPGGRGTYQLNPVGYNLIAHALPRKGEDGRGSMLSSQRRSARRPKSTPTKRKSKS